MVFVIYFIRNVQGTIGMVGLLAPLTGTTFTSSCSELEGALGYGVGRKGIGPH